MDLHKIDEKSPIKKKLWKIRPRRSLGLPTESDWKRYIDGFNVLEPLNTKVAKTKRRLSSVVGNLDVKNDSPSSSQPSISGFSSGEEDNLNDIKPLPGSHVGRNLSKFSSHISWEKKKHVKRKPREEKQTVENDDVETDIIAYSPVQPKAAKTRRSDPEGIHIDITSPVKIAVENTGKHPDGESGLPEEDTSISDYGSQSQDRSNLRNPPHDPKVGDSESPCISTESSPNSINGSNKPRTSDWLKHLQWAKESPQRLFEDEELSQEDSAKKKKLKYKRGGLAERLQKVLSRRKSAMTIWHHRVTSTKQTPQDTKNSLVVQLLETHTEYSTLVARCRILRTNDGNQSEEQPRTFAEATALFTMSTTKKLALEKGTIVMIYPPWQSLRTKEGEKIILCTQFCMRMPDDAFNSLEETPVAVPSPSNKPVSARWRCPCVVDASIPYKSCPAFYNQSSTDQNPPTQDWSPINSPSVFQHGACLQTSLLSQGSNQPRRGILESIESQGDLHYYGITIEGTVQRIFYKSNPSSLSETTMRPFMSLSYRPAGAPYTVSVLVQDDLGMCCEVVLPNLCDQHEVWKDLLENGIGKVWRFQGLRQQCRTHTQKSPGLFQMIESVWPREGVTLQFSTSQEGSQQTEQEFHQSNAQGFCYRLVASTVDSSCRPTTEPSNYRPPACASLCDIRTDDPSSSRISFCCKAFYHEKEDKHSGSSGVVLYVMDDSLLKTVDCSPYRRISVRPQCHITHQVLDLLRCSDCYLAMKDISVRNGHLYCDEFSRIFTFQDINANPNNEIVLGTFLSFSDLRAVRPRPPPLSSQDNISEGDLFYVSGIVLDVDEDTAYSWEVCDVCKEGDLTVLHSTSDLLYCSHCERPVTSPNTHFNLEVYISITTGDVRKITNAKLKLLQSTIEKLLPDEGTGQGYEVQHVQGKLLGPIPCIVRSVNRGTTQRPGEVQLEEIYFND